MLRNSPSLTDKTHRGRRRAAGRQREKTACLSTLLAAGTALLLAEPLRPPTTLAPVAGKNINPCMAGGRDGGGGDGRGWDKEEAKD